MVKLTPELLNRVSSHLNPLKERELELRGLNIPTIENLAAYQGGYDCLNLSENSIVTLGNLPLSTRLQSINLSSNSVTTISPALSTTVPNLVTLTLTSNQITSLSSLNSLSSCANLKYLSLLSNPVRSEKFYREFCIWKIPSLHVLDFKRITDAERASSKALFLTEETQQPTALAVQLSTSTVSASATTNGEQKEKGHLMNDEEKEKIRLAITNAKSIEEVRRLQKMLAEGFVPDEKKGGKA